MPPLFRERQKPRRSSGRAAEPSDPWECPRPLGAAGAAVARPRPGAAFQTSSRGAAAVPRRGCSPGPGRSRRAGGAAGGGRGGPAGVSPARRERGASCRPFLRSPPPLPRLSFFHLFRPIYLFIFTGIIKMRKSARCCWLLSTNLSVTQAETT